MSRFLLSLAALVLVYLLVLASIDPWDVGAGVVLGATLLVAARGFVFGGHLGRVEGLVSRVLGVVPFVVATIWEILRGTWAVTLVVLHLRPLRHPGIVAVPFRERTRLGVAVSALLLTLSPGAYLVDVDDEERVMLLHVLDASDPDAVRAEFQEFYRRFQRQVFP